MAALGYKVRGPGGYAVRGPGKYAVRRGTNPGDPCEFCPSESTPAQVRVTTSGIVLCEGCLGDRFYYEIGPNSPNTVNVLDQNFNGHGPCVWGALVSPRPYHKIYSYPAGTENCSGEYTYIDYLRYSVMTFRLLSATQGLLVWTNSLELPPFTTNAACIFYKGIDWNCISGGSGTNLLQECWSAPATHALAHGILGEATVEPV